MSNMVTRCPKCATSFRITSAQLQSAKGAVRCGSCLHIFKAQDHLVTVPAPSPAATKASLGSTQEKAGPAKTVQPIKTSPVPPGPVSPPPQTGATKPPGTTGSTPAKVTISKPNSPAAVNAPTAAKSPSPVAAAKASPPLVGTTAKAAPQPAIKADPKPSGMPGGNPTQTVDVEDIDQFVFSQAEIDQELAALSEDEDLLISDDMEGADPKLPQVEELGFSEFSLDTSSKASVSLFERNSRDETPDDYEEGTDESWAESLLDEVNEENRIEAVKHRLMDSEEDKTDPLWIAESPEDHDYSTQEIVEEDAAPDFRGMFAEEELSEELRAMSSGRPLARTQESDPDGEVDENPTQPPPIRAYDTSRAALLMNIMPEPVVMTSRRKKSWQRKQLWSRLSLLMIVLLLAQIAWLQFDTLSRIHPYRSGYEFICPYLGCQVPALVDRSKIRVRNLLVRKHPDIDNALMVDVIIINTAPFNQVFPDLVMAFSDINDKPLASRRFTPQEYLRGELAGYDLMPQNQPVHINLELVDPGEEAVNYKIEPF